MLSEAEKAAGEHETEQVEVPGAYDTPLAADRLARREDVDAVAVIGAIVKGDTEHDTVIGNTAAKQLSEVSIRRDTPVTLGITGPGMTAEEAAERTHYAAKAVEAAIELVKESGEYNS
ncbi:MAG: 6,7-dimethyl-8-ribityllumazine synthase [Candidatus Nanohaloarchaea archaeon]